MNSTPPLPLTLGDMDTSPTPVIEPAHQNPLQRKITLIVPGVSASPDPFVHVRPIAPMPSIEKGSASQHPSDSEELSDEDFEEELISESTREDLLAFNTVRMFESLHLDDKKKFPVKRKKLASPTDDFPDDDCKSDSGGKEEEVRKRLKLKDRSPAKPPRKWSTSSLEEEQTLIRNIEQRLPAPTPVQPSVYFTSPLGPTPSSMGSGPRALPVTPTSLFSPIVEEEFLD